MTIQAQLADGRVLEFPDGTDPSVVQATVKKVIANPMAAQSTASLEAAKAAPFSFGDIAKSFGAGVVGGAKSLVDVVGSGSGVSQGLGEAQDYLQRSLSPERQAEIARDQELMQRAQEKGIGSEIMAGLKTVAHAPFQSIAQGVGSSLPMIVGGLATLPESAPAALALGVQRASSLLIAAAQGVGETKGSIHDEVKKAYMDQGVPEAEAAKLAVKAQEYTLEKAPMLIGSAAFGALDALTGFEKSTSRALRDAFKGEERKLEGKGLKAAIAALPEKAPELPTLGKSALRTAGEEGLTEALQGGYGQAAQNIGMSQAGFETPTFQGVGGAAAHDALIGALTGGAMSPLHFQGAKADYAADQFLRQVKTQQELEQQKADALKEQQEKRAKTEQSLNVPKMLALPAPAKAAEEEKDPLQNPVGRVTEDELGKAIGNNTVVNYLNKYRRDNNLPKLKSYSIEDIKDAMTAQNPEGEEGALNAILAYKTNYQNETYTPEDIQNRAVAKNVATETKGFSDFLTRATGKSDLNTMTQPELHSVATALDALPRTGKEQQLVLPEGSNATRFTQDQYNQGVTQALMNVKEGKPVTLDQAREAIKAQTDLKTDRDADHLLKTAASNEDLIVEKGTGFQAVSPGGVVLGTYGTEAEAKRKHRRADILPVETQLVRAPEEVNQEKVAQLPEGYEINKKTVAGEAGPAAYVVREDGSQTNASQTFADEADAKDRLNILARKREANAVAEEAAADRIRQDLEKRQAKIAQMEADGQTDTAEHKNAVAAFQAANVAGSAKITEHLDKAEAFRKPLKIVPLGKKTAKVEKHTVIKKGKEVASFPDRVKAEQHILASASEAELQAIADRGGVFGKRAQTELQDRQRTETGIKVKGTAEGLEKAGVRTPEVEAKLKELEAKLKPMLDKFGLGEVGLNVVRAIENDAEGAWGGLNNLIRIAFNADNPIRTMRHEALHALKDLGFFTPQQWEALKREAKKTWVDKYLKGVAFNDTMSRFDAYTNMGLSDEAILEEAIADAFGSWEGGAKPPPGMMASLFKRLQQFFAALRQALTGAGFQSADEIFGKIERGELKAGKEATGTEAKLSLAEKEGKEKIDPNDVSRVVIDGPYADAAIRTMNSQITQTSNPLEVDDVGRLFDKAFMDQFERKGDWKNPADFQRAVAQAVTELKHQLQQTKSGLDWYEEDIADAFKQTQKYIPSLKKPEKRALFSVIAGIMSPSVNARDNWVIAAQAYQHYEKTGILPGSNPATGSLWQGGLESANKKKQLDMLNAMLQPKSKGGLGEKATIEWLQGDHTVAEITNFRKKYGGMGKSSTGGKLSDILPGFTAFGPKVGPFVMNINGIHDVTVDVWMTRTFNRYFGQMMGPDGTMLRSPTEPQRAAIKKLAMDAAAQVGIKPYQVQSTLWFFEQQLFNKLGTGAKSYGFSDGAIKFIESQGGAAPAKGAPANVGANAPANKPAGKQAVGNSAQAARPSTGQQGVSGEQKLSLGRNADRVSFVGPAFDERKLRGAGDRGRGSEVRNLAPLEGSPSVKGFSGPDPRLVSVAEQYAKDNGIDYRRQREYVQVDEDRARRIADAYDKMEHAPQDPEVKEAYQNLIRQTRAQYDALVKNGYKFWFTDYNIPDNAEYLSSPWNAMRDIRANKTMGVFPTNEGFGTTDFDPAANPLLEDTGLEWPVGSPNSTKKSPVLANDLFRAVHDAFGHGLEGAGFRARGEENAWLAHSKLFTGSALAAITSETRGQNSWLNYGPQGEKNRTAKIEDTTFADQKTGLMPSWTWQEGQDKYSLKFAEPALKPKQGEGIVLGEKQPDAQTFVGLHYGQNKVDELSGSKYGTGIRGAERRRLADTDDQRIKKRIYFYIPKEDGSMPRNEAGLGGHVYTQQFDNIAAGPVVDRLFSEAGGDANQFESNVVDAGYDGYAMPSMGMMVILNHDAPVQYHGTMGELAESDKKFSLRTFFSTPESAEKAAYKKAPPATPEFKRFFGASKVMEEGRPQVMYHASPNEFETFSEYKPIFISPDAEQAQRFSALKRLGSKAKKDYIYPLWVRAETPFDYENPAHVNRLMESLSGQLSMNDYIEMEKEVKRGNWSKIEDPRTLALLKNMGFDSFYVFEGNTKNLAVFNANQVKSVTGNIGDFSENKSIKYSLPNIGAAADARVNETTQTREHKGWLERVTDWLKPENMADLRASFIHRYNQLGVYDRLLAEKMGGKVLLADMSAEAAANMSDLSASVTASVFGIGNRKGGIPVYKNGMTTVDTSVRGPLQILAPLAQFNDPKAYQHYQYWAGVKRGMRYEADGKEKNFDKGDIALAEKVRQEYLAKGVDFNAIQKEMNTYNDGLVDYMVKTGVIAPERGAEFKKHMDYIPFYRQINGEDTVGPKIFNSISGVKPPKKLKGSEAPLTDYLESIVQNTQAAINAGMKNMAAQRAINVAMQLGPIAGAQRLNVVNNAPDCVQVLENGKQVSYRVADQLFINAVKSLNMAEMPFLGIFSAPSNLLRNLVTKDPGFMLANLARDSLSAWVTSGAKMTPIAGTVSKFVEALGGKSPALHALLNAGILGGYEFSSGVIKSGEVLEKDLNKKYGGKGGFKPLKTFTGIWDALEHGTEASDAATRMAVYERVLAETGNETEALYRALEVMNFNRKGSSPVVRILTAAIPFLNARIQGLDVFYRTAMGTNVSANAKEMQKAFFVRGATLMALSAAYFLAVSDDDEWKKQEQETKDNYWIAPGIGKFPTPFEVGFLFKTVPERIMAYTMKDDTGQDFMASMQRGLLNTFAFNPIPQIAKPIIEYNANYNFFTGRPIVGQGMEGLEPKYQVGPNTTKTAEALGNLLGMPPIKLDQLINSYTGTMGMYAMSVIDAVLDTQDNSPHASKRFEQLPIIRRFALDPEARGNITQYYELKKAVDAATQTENYLLKAGKPDEFREFMEQNKGLLAIKPYISNVEKTMKQMREMRKMVQGAEMSADEKRDTLTAIGQAENNLNANIQTIKKMVSEAQ